MKLADLTPETCARIRRLCYDRIIEKHEGPERWKGVLDHTDFIVIDGRHVLLPIPEDHLPKISVLRSVISHDEQSLTLFLKDTTHVSDPQDEALMAGFIAVCDKMPGEDFFIAIVYHEWFISAGFRIL